MKRLVLLLLAMACINSPAMSQDQVDGFVARVYQQSGTTMPYRLFIPAKYKKSRKYPVIVWLHGGGGVGTDNLRQSYTEYPGMGHEIWNRVFKERGLVEWLYAQHK